MLEHKDLIEICNLELAMNNYVKTNYIQCRQPSCNGQVTKRKLLQNHLFIETDQVDCNFTMSDFPETIHVNDDQ